MKLDLFKKEWLDVVFEGRNKSYGAYDLRKKSGKASLVALGIGAAFFALAIAAPQLFSGLFNGLSNDEANMDKKIVTIKLPPKEKPKEIIPPPKPPPPKVDQVKFVKLVVAKKEEATEEPPKITPEIKKTGATTEKGNPDAPTNIKPPGDGDTKAAEEDPNKLYNTAGIEVKPEFPGGMDKFYKYVGNNYQTPEDVPSGKVYVSFVVEKDGSLTDIKVIRDMGYGSGAEAIRVLKRCPKWAPGEQNGKKVRCTYQLPISIQAPE